MNAMKSTATIRALAVMFVVAWVASIATPSWAEDAKPAEKKKANPRGPLPVYYKEVIDNQQRKEIYKIQDTYRPKIAELEAQLKDLTDKRDAEVEALLRPEQKEKLKELAAEAKSKRGGAKKPAEAPAATAAKDNP